MLTMSPILAPLLPVVLAVVAVVLRESVSPPPASQPAAATHRVVPKPMPMPIPRATRPGPAPTRRMRITSESSVRVRIGAGSTARYAVIRSVGGSFRLDPQGVLERLDLDIGFDDIRDPDGRPSPHLAWGAFGVRRDSRMEFHGGWSATTQSNGTGSSTITVSGSVRIGGHTRRLVVKLHLVQMPQHRVRLVGRVTILPSDYGLQGRRNPIPFAAEEPVVLIWNLVFEPSFG
jgi:polyisoprenoid-binding protein YceI